VTEHYRDMIDGMFWKYSQGIRNRDKRQGIEDGDRLIPIFCEVAHILIPLASPLIRGVGGDFDRDIVPPLLRGVRGDQILCSLTKNW